MLNERNTSTVYYHDFRGVDFSSDQTQVHEQRFSYLVNMYKDYQSGQGKAIETIPGFRKLFKGTEGAVHGMRIYRKRKSDKSFEDILIIQVGARLFELDGQNNVKQIGNKGSTLGGYSVEDTDVSSFFPSDSPAISIVFGDYLYFFGIFGNYSLKIYDTETKTIYTTDKRPAYIPTIMTGVKSDGTGGKEFQQRNVFTPYYYIKFAEADGTTSEYFTYCDLANGDTTSEGLLDVYVNGELVESGIEEERPIADIKFIFGPESSIKVQFTYTPKKGSIVSFKVRGNDVSMFSGDNSVIQKCTIATTYDNRIFLSGNPNYPNAYFYSGLNDPTYWGILNYDTCGLPSSPITGLLPIADTLAVLKDDTLQDGSVYYLSPQITDSDVVAKAYPKTQGLNGIGCIGAYTNFLDDPVFVSRLGLKAIGQLSIRNERGIEDRSSLIDAKLLNLGEDALKASRMTEWNGYLLLLVDGKIFMADSRQRYADEMGNAQYEWYYLEDIGVYDGQYDNGTGEYIGGTYKKATQIITFKNNVYFGCEDGSVCCFNFDKRTEYGDFEKEWYTFNGRTISCACATKLDNCGVPHLTKNTEKHSTVIKTRTMYSAEIQIAIRTNGNPYKSLGRINTTSFNFDDMDFADFSFLTEGENIFAMNEKEKKWVEKQYYLYSDKFRKPFSLQYITYSYYVAGRIK